MSKKKTVLIVCTHNAARSQMAEGWFRHLAGDRFDVHSAGLEPTQVHPLAIEVMNEAGVDISQQQATHLREHMGRLTAHYLIIVCAQAESQCPRMFPGMLKREFWPFEDPSAGDGSDSEMRDRFRETRDQIRDTLERWLASTDEAETPTASDDQTEGTK